MLAEIASLEKWLRPAAVSSGEWKQLARLSKKQLRNLKCRAASSAAKGTFKNWKTFGLPTPMVASHIYYSVRWKLTARLRLYSYRSEHGYFVYQTPPSSKNAHALWTRGIDKSRTAHFPFSGSATKATISRCFAFTRRKTDSLPAVISVNEFPMGGRKKELRSGSLIPQESRIAPVAVVLHWSNRLSSSS